MKKLLLIPFLLLSIAGYSQMNTFGGIGLRVNDTTTYQTNAAAFHTAGYYDIYFNNQATNDHWDIWNGSSYDHIFAFGQGSGGGHVIEEEGTPLTQRADLNFVGAGVTATDAGGKTVVTISGAIGVQDLYISSVALWPTTTNGCSPLSQTEVATSLFNIQSLDFDQTTQEFAQLQIVLPRKYNNGTITAVVYWTAASGSGGVVWGISGGAYSNDDPLSTAFGAPQTTSDTFIAANDVHITTATAAITLAGTPADADFIALQISRNPADGSDTLNADAKLLGISIRITTDAQTDN